MDPWEPSWDPVEILELIHAQLCVITCVGGEIDEKGEGRCERRVPDREERRARLMLRMLPRLADANMDRWSRPHMTNQAALLQEIAELLTCQSHRKEVKQVVGVWSACLTVQSHKDEAERRARQARIEQAQQDCATDFPEELWTNEDFKGMRYHPGERSHPRDRDRSYLRDAMEDLKRRRAARIASLGVREQLEHACAENRARRRAEEAVEATARADKMRAECKKREEYDQLRLKQEETARANKKRREEEAIIKAESEKSSWSTSWFRYEQQWKLMERLGAYCTKDQLVGALPWPVKDDRIRKDSTAGARFGFTVPASQDIKEFILHAPNNVARHPVEFRKLLRAEARRWHEDKILQRFPWAKDCEEVMSLANCVTQVVCGLLQKM